VLVAAVLVLTMSAPPQWAMAAGGLASSADGLRATVSLLSAVGGGLNLPIRAPEKPSTWPTPGPQSQNPRTNTLNVAGLLGVNLGTLASAGLITLNANPAVGGGSHADASVANLNLLGKLTSVGAIKTSCDMTPSGITTAIDVAALKVLGAGVNPDINLAVKLPGVLNATVDERTAAYDPTSGVLTYTVRAVDVDLLSGLSAIAGGKVVIAESVCKGVVTFGSVGIAGSTLNPGQSDTPTVTVTNTGEVAAPNTVIKIPAPPTGYTVGTPTVTGGGTCTKDTNQAISCTGVTVPGGGNAKVSIPVTLKANASGSTNWVAGASQITVDSTPIPGAGATISVNGGGTLVTAKPPLSTGGAITVSPLSLPAGKNGVAKVLVSNQGPSDAANTTITIPRPSLPTDVVLNPVKVGGTACTGTTTITCSNVTVPAGGSVSVDFDISAGNLTTPGATVTVAGAATSVNGVGLTGGGTLVTITDPDVNLDNGVSFGSMDAVPGGPQVTQKVRIANKGTTNATGTRITLPALPTGYALGTVTTTGGGTCPVTNGVVTCTGVTVPAKGYVDVSIPVTLTSGATADWTGEVKSVGTGSTGSSTGTLIAAKPSFSLGVTSTPPAAGTVSPGQQTTMTVKVYDQGPSDARNVDFYVVPPANTTFVLPTGISAALCPTRTASLLTCKATILASDPGVTLTLPLQVSASAGASQPVGGGCVSTDGNMLCDPGDPKLAPIALRTPLRDRLTITTVKATITPGGTPGTGKIRLTSTENEAGVSISVPTTPIPAGFTPVSASVSGGTCAPVVAGSPITCTGVSLAAGVPKDVSVLISLSPTTQPNTWTPSITATAGSEQTAATGALATTAAAAATLNATVSVPPDNSVEPGRQANVQMSITNMGPSAATSAVVTVTPPTGTTFGQLSGAAATLCPTNIGVALTCYVTLPAVGGVTSTVTLPVNVPSSAGPDTVLDGGCVSTDGVPGCLSADDKSIPQIELKWPFASRVQLTSDPADVTPGSSGDATLTVKAVHGGLSGLNVSVPLPTATGVSADPAVTVTIGGVSTPCTVGATAVLCSGMTLADGQTADIKMTVKATPSAGPSTWQPTDTVQVGSDTTSASPGLARVGAAKYKVGASVVVPATVLPGDSGSLQVTVNNTTGPSDADGARITVWAPTGSHFGPITTGPAAAACTVMPDNTRAQCTFDLPYQGTTTFDLPIVIDTTAPTGQSISGCVDLNNDGLCVPATDRSIQINVGTPLAKRLTVALNPAQSVPGDPVTSVGTVTMTSTKAETGLVVAIPYDGKDSKISVGSAPITGTGSGSCTTNTGKIVCTGVSLDPNVSRVIRVGMTAAADASPSTWAATGMTVQAGLETASAAGNLAALGAPVTSFDVVGTVPPPGTVSAGGTAPITVRIDNAGPSDAVGRTVEVNAPTGTTFATMPNECRRTLDDVATCTLTIPAGTPGNGRQLAFTVAIPAGVDPFAPLKGGCVNLDNIAACTGPDDEVIDDIVLKVPFARRATVNATAATVTPGGSATASLTVTANHGALSGVNVVVPTDGLPGKLHVTGITGIGVSCTPPVPPSKDWTCSIPAIADQDGTTLQIAVSADADATTETWTAQHIKVGDAADSIDVDRKLAGTGTPDYTLTPGAVLNPGTILPGGTGTYTVSVQHGGPSVATQVKYGVMIPAGASFTSVPAGCTADVDNQRRLTCSSGFAVGATVTKLVDVRVSATANPGASLDGGCVDIDNNKFCAVPPDAGLPSIIIGTPFDRQVTVRTNPSVTIRQGDHGDAQVFVTSTVAQTVSVEIPLDDKPVRMSFIATPTVTGGGTCTPPSGNVVCSNIAVPAGGTATVTLPMQVDPGFDGVWATNAIKVTGTGGSITGGGVIAQTKAPEYKLTATTTAQAGNAVLPGGTATIKAKITNSGTGKATAIPFTVYAPAGTTFGALAEPARSLCPTVTPTTLTCTVTLDPGASTGTLALPVVVPETSGGTIADGCFDFSGNGACGDQADADLPSFELRTPLPQVISEAPGNSTEKSTPGGTAVAEVDIDATEVRNGLVVTIDTSDRPAGLTVTSAKIGSTTCQVTTGLITCTGVNFADSETLILALDLTSAPITAEKTWTPAVTVTEYAGTVVKDSAQLRPEVVTVNPPSSTVEVTVTPPAAGKVLPGGTGDLVVKLHNSGPSTRIGATYAFRAPDNTRFTALNNNADTYCDLISDVLVSCTLNVIPGHTSFALGVRVDNTATGGTTLGHGCFDANTNNVCDSGEDAIAIQLGKTFAEQAPMTVTAGTVTAGRTGVGAVRLTADKDFTGLKVTIPLSGLPAKLKVSGATAAGGVACTTTSQISCTGVTARAGEHNLVSVTFGADPDVAAGTTWPAAVTLEDGYGGTSTAHGVLIAAGPPESTITYSPVPVTGTVKPGDSVTMAMTVANAGPADAAEILVRVKAPNGTQLGTPSPAGCSANPARSVYDCKVDLRAGASVKWNLPIQIPAVADPDTPVGGGCVDKGQDGTCDVDLPTIQLTPTPAQAVSLTAGPVAIVPGRTGTVTVTVAATHAQDDLTVTIPIDTLPDGMTITGARVGGSSCAVTTGKVTCSNVDVAAGGTAVITLDVAAKPTAKPGDFWTTDVTVSGGTRSRTVTLARAAVVDAANVVLTASVVDVPSAGTLHAGKTGTIGVALTNSGTSFAGKREYSIIAPDGATFPAQTGGACVKVSDRQLNCTVDVNGNAGTQFPVTVSVDAGADPATPLTGGCVREGFGATCGGDVPIPPIQLFQAIAGRVQVTGKAGTIVPGSTGDGRIRVSSPVAITGAVITIPLGRLPTGFTVTGASGPTGSTCAIETTEVRCTAVSIKSGDTTPVTLSVRTAGNVLAAKTWTDTASLSAGRETVTGTADIVTTGTPSAPVTFEVALPTGSVAPGETTTLTITATNAGPSVATGRTATINAPTHTKFVALTGRAAGDCKLTSATQITCTYDLDPADSLSWDVPLRVDSTARDGDTISGGCVSADANATCGGSTDVEVVETPVEPLLRDTGRLVLGSAVVKPGESGSATVVLTSTVDHDGLTLTVPLSSLPTGFTVSGATMDDASCTVANGRIRCTGLDLEADVPRTLRTQVGVGPGVTTGAAWAASGIVLADASDATDKLTTSGVLVTTDAAAYLVSVTIGSPSVTKPASGRTTVLPIHVLNSGPGDAKPYQMVVVVPPGTKHGTLPAGCTESSKASIVICKVDVPAGESADLALPIVVDDDAKAGDQVADGCLDGALGTTATTKFDYTCGGSDDVPVPGFEVGRHAVNLAISYGGAKVPIVMGQDSLVVKVPYQNDGTLIADNVTFTVEPPADVWVMRATVLIDDSDAEVRALAMTSVDTTCTGVASGAENAVTCEAPDSAALSGSELWLTLKVGTGAEPGTRSMRVTVSTSSADGHSTDNAVDIPLVLTAASDNDTDDMTNPDNGGSGEDDGSDRGSGGGGSGSGGGSLAKTGAQITGLALLSMIMLVAGFATVTLARERGLRRGTATRAQAGSHASAEGIAAASREALRVGRNRRPPRRARSAPARRHRSGE
jgi:uncharacterized repeat protein (TIGR01451 family)